MKLPHILKPLLKKEKITSVVWTKHIFFSRAQLKYGLERKDYLRRWSDRPLMQESSLANGSSAAESNYSGQFSENGFINHGSYLLESKLLEKFNFTGFAFFVQATGILDIVNHVGTPGTGDIKLLAEFTYRAKLQVIKLSPHTSHF